MKQLNPQLTQLSTKIKDKSIFKYKGIRINKNQEIRYSKKIEFNERDTEFNKKK